MRQLWIVAFLIVLVGCGGAVPSKPSPAPPTALLPTLSPGPASDPVVSGSVLWTQFDFTTQTNDIWSLSPVPGAEPRRLTDCDRARCAVIDLDLAADGSSLAYAFRDLSTFKTSVRVRDLRSGAETTLRENLDALTDLRWSPDGRRLAVIEGRTTQAPVPEQSLVVLDRESGELTTLLSGQFFMDDLAWAGDGAAVLFSQAARGTPPTGWRVFRAPLDGSAVSQAVPGARLAGVSPDGRFWALLTELGNNRFNLAQYVPAADQTSPLLPDDITVTNAAWSADNSLAAITSRSGANAIFIFPAGSTEASISLPITQTAGPSLIFLNDATVLVEVFDPADSAKTGLLEIKFDPRGDRSSQRQRVVFSGQSEPVRLAVVP